MHIRMYVYVVYIWVHGSVQCGMSGIVYRYMLHVEEVSCTLIQYVIP
jgi:hypothetical protein